MFVAGGMPGVPLGGQAFMCSGHTLFSREYSSDTVYSDLNGPYREVVTNAAPCVSNTQAMLFFTCLFSDTVYVFRAPQHNVCVLIFAFITFCSLIFLQNR